MKKKSTQGKGGRKMPSAHKPLTREQVRKKFAGYKFGWVVLLGRKLARLDFPEAQLGKPAQVVTEHGLPALTQAFRAMSEGAQLARELAIVRQINPKPVFDEYMHKVEQRLGRAWLEGEDKGFLHDFRKVKKATAHRIATANAYRWMLRHVKEVEDCTGKTQILRLVKKHCPEWRSNEGSFFALLREIGLPVRR